MNFLKKNYWKISKWLYKKHPKTFALLKNIFPEKTKERAKKFLYSKKDVSYKKVVFEQKKYDGPLVSVIVPYFNASEYLNETIESILNQTIKNLEILIIDDGSDNSRDVEFVKNFKAEKTKVYFKKNGGVSSARNFGIEKSKGKYICCLDSDDTIEPTYLEKMVSLMEINPCIGFVYSDAKVFGEVSEYWRVEDFNLKNILSYNHITTAAVFQKNIWEKVGGYDITMKEGYEDWDFWIKAGMNGFRGKAIHEPLFNYRRHGISRDKIAYEKFNKILKRKLKKKYWKLNLPFYASRIIKNNYCDADTKNPYVNFENFKLGKKKK